MTDELAVEVLKAYYPQVIQAVADHPTMQLHTRDDIIREGQTKSYATRFRLEIPSSFPFQWDLEFYCDWCAHPADFGVNWYHHISPHWDSCDHCWDKHYDQWVLYATDIEKIVLEDPNLERFVHQRIIQPILPIVQKLRTELTKGLDILQSIEESYATAQQA